MSSGIFGQDVRAYVLGRPIDVVHIGRGCQYCWPVRKLLVPNGVWHEVCAADLRGAWPAGIAETFLLPWELPVVLLVEQGQVHGRKRRDQVLLSVVLLYEFVVALGKLANFLLGRVLSRRQKIRLVVRVLLEMLDLLLAVQHLPALDAEHFAVRFLLYGVQPIDEGRPLRRISLYHCR